MPIERNSQTGNYTLRYTNKKTHEQLSLELKYESEQTLGFDSRLNQWVEISKIFKGSRGQRQCHEIDNMLRKFILSEREVSVRNYPAELYHTVSFFEKMFDIFQSLVTAVHSTIDGSGAAVLEKDYFQGTFETFNFYYPILEKEVASILNCSGNLGRQVSADQLNGIMDNISKTVSEYLSMSQSYSNVFPQQNHAYEYFMNQKRNLIQLLGGQEYCRGLRVQSKDSDQGLAQAYFSLISKLFVQTKFCDDDMAILQSNPNQDKVFQVRFMDMFDANQDFCDMLDQNPVAKNNSQVKILKEKLDEIMLRKLQEDYSTADMTTLVQLKKCLLQAAGIVAQLMDCVR